MSSQLRVFREKSRLSRFFSRSCGVELQLKVGSSRWSRSWGYSRLGWRKRPRERGREIEQPYLLYQYHRQHHLQPHCKIYVEDCLLSALNRCENFAFGPAPRPRGRSGSALVGVVFAAALDFLFVEPALLARAKLEVALELNLFCPTEPNARLWLLLLPSFEASEPPPI